MNWHASTLAPAYVMRQEQIVGSLVVGKQADLIVLSQNLFNIPPTGIRHTRVERTYLAGRLVYARR